MAVHIVRETFYIRAYKMEKGKGSIYMIFVPASPSASCSFFPLNKPRGERTLQPNAIFEHESLERPLV